MKINTMKRAAALAAAITVLAMTGCSDSKNNTNKTSTEVKTAAVTSTEAAIDADDIEVGYEEDDAVSVSFSDSGIETAGSGVTVDGTVLTITAAGTYKLSGTCSNGRIVIEAGKEDKVKLVLDDLDLTCKDNAVITARTADKVFLLLESETVNTLADATAYDLAADDNTDAAVFAKCDLIINGDGTLTVTGNYKHGIVSKDDLVITGGNITVKAASSGISGKDSVKISAGSIDVTSGKDGVKSDNSEDEGKGIISITGGTIKINAGGDGISAAKELQISGGDFNITTGGGSVNASMKSEAMPNGDRKQGFGGKGDFTPPDMGNFDMGDLGTPPDMGERPDRGDFDPSKFDNNGERPDFGDMGTPPEMPDGKTFEKSEEKSADSDNDTSSGNTETSSDTVSTSAKALKSGGIIMIENGTITIDSADDSLHCDGSANISGGSITASSGDDGIHVGGDLIIDGGDVTITKSYEGIEGMTVTVSGGTINVTANDDGINCAGGSDTGSSDRMGRDQFAAQEGVYLKISGGTVNVDAGGDGLDSNGDLYIEGGMITVSGPENSGNGSIDHNGSASITGGTIIAAGAVGMEEMFDEEGTTQCAVLHDFTKSFSADTEFTVTDKDGNTILSFTDPKTWQGVIFSSPDLKQGETYTVSAGGESAEITIDGVITSNSTGGMGNMGGMGGHGRNGGRFGTSQTMT